MLVLDAWSMVAREIGADEKRAAEQVLGYLNFSSGAHDPKLFTNLNLLWETHAASNDDAAPASGDDTPRDDNDSAADDTESADNTESACDSTDDAGSADDTASGSDATCQRVGATLREQLKHLAGESSAFTDADQACGVVHLVFDNVLPAYREFHEDLLFHNSDEVLFNAFFVGRVCEAVLQQGGPWDEVERITTGTLTRLNDYIGYRPVAVLESRKIEAYEHERVRPVPYYLRDVGVAAGPASEVVALALSLITNAPDDLLQAAYFDPDMLDELAVDPRAYDFDHPVNKRPNYHFGQWDPHQVNQHGHYRRFVVQQVTLEALMSRLDCDELPADEVRFEAAAVLAGTILMAAGVSGGGPDSFDSNTTLTTMLPRIAGYRDRFYEHLIDQLPVEHAERLRVEAKEKRQPFGAARQHLNAQLAKQRAAQLEHVQLAKIFARMGYAEAAFEESNVVPVASARLLSQIECQLTAAEHAIADRDIPVAVDQLGAAVELLHRGIRCGAIVDPWNILGFDAHFSLFPALENSVHDHRVDELIELVEQVFAVYSRAWNEAARSDDVDLSDRISRAFKELTTWWRQFAAHEVTNVEAVDSADAYTAAEHVARALNLWYKGGAEAGDIGFWAPHAEMFDSPQAYALVIDALQHQSDAVAAMGLLVHWISHVDDVPLEHGDSSFHRQAERWLLDVRESVRDVNEADTDEAWRLTHKFLDYLEANAETYWEVPTFDLGSGTPRAKSNGDDPDLLTELLNADEEDDDEEESLFDAAYEDMVYRDSANDGVEGEVFDTDTALNDDLGEESVRLCDRLAFQSTLARLWRSSAFGFCLRLGDSGRAAERVGAMQGWLAQSRENRAALMRLTDSVASYSIPTPMPDHESMLEYDRLRVLKETLLERIIVTAVEIDDAMRLLQAAVVAAGSEADKILPEASEEGRHATLGFACVLASDHEGARRETELLIKALANKPLLYVPLNKGGQPETIVATRVRQQSIQDLLRCLPRLGLFREAHQLIETAREMERNNPVGPGAVTEFDELFKIGYRAIVESLVAAAHHWDDVESAKPSDLPRMPLVYYLEQVTEIALLSWLAHSRTLRLSVLEKVRDKRSWKGLVEFVERYGGELFTQRFLNYSNIRAILHQGVDAWLEQLIAHESRGYEVPLVGQFEGSSERAAVVDNLTLVLEAIVENYGEYRDYNSTTTQSDRGELLYTLLDFLRLRTDYDRVCWNLKPVVIAHETLVRAGRKKAAQLWRRALRERIGSEADKFIEKMQRLQKKYAMQMPSISDRIGERFLRPLIIDRLCSLVEPALEEVRKEGASPSFRMLRYETEFLSREPAGVGFDLPPWLISLEEEVRRSMLPPYERDDYDELSIAVPVRTLSREEVERLLEEWTAA